MFKIRNTYLHGHLRLLMVLILQLLESLQQFPIEKKEFKGKLWSKRKKLSYSKTYFKICIRNTCSFIFTLRVSHSNQFPQDHQSKCQLCLKKKLVNLFSFYASAWEWLLNGAKLLRLFAGAGMAPGWQVELWKAPLWVSGHPGR